MLSCDVRSVRSFVRSLTRAGTCCVGLHVVRALRRRRGAEAERWRSPGAGRSGRRLDSFLFKSRVLRSCVVQVVVKLNADLTAEQLAAKINDAAAGVKATCAKAAGEREFRCDVTATADGASGDKPTANSDEVC
jgi:hypothetical protein